MKIDSKYFKLNRNYEVKKKHTYRNKNSPKELSCE